MPPSLTPHIRPAPPNKPQINPDLIIRPDGHTWRWAVQSCSAKQGLGLKEGMDWLAIAVRGKSASLAGPKRSSAAGGTNANELEGLASRPPPAFTVMGAPTPISSS